MPPLTSLLPIFFKCRDAWHQSNPTEMGRDKLFTEFAQWVKKTYAERGEESPDAINRLFSLLVYPNDHAGYSCESMCLKLHTNTNMRLFRLAFAADVRCGEEDFRVRDVLEFIVKEGYAFRFYAILCPFFTFRGTHIGMMSKTVPDGFGTTVSTRFQQLWFLSACAEISACMSQNKNKRRKLTNSKHVTVVTEIKGLDNFDASVGQRVGKVIQTVVEGWDMFAKELGFKDVEDMVSPYVTLEAKDLRFEVIERRTEGFPPKSAATRWRSDVALVTRREETEATVFDRSAEIDCHLRDCSKVFVSDMYGMVRSSTLYTTKEKKNWRSLNRFETRRGGLPNRFSSLPEDMVESLQSLNASKKATDISNVDDGGESTQDQTVKIAEDYVQNMNKIRGASATTESFGTSEGIASSPVKPKLVSVEAAMKTVEQAMKPFSRFYNASFHELEEVEELLGNGRDLKQKVQLLLCDPPYNIRRKGGKRNSEYDALSVEQMEEVVNIAAEILKEGGHAILFCTVQQFVVWESKFRSHRTECNNSAGGRQTFMVDSVPMVFTKNPNVYSGFPGKQSCTLSNSAEFAVHVKKNGLSYEEEAKKVNYKAFNYVPSSYPGFKNVINNIRGLLPGEQLRVSKTGSNETGTTALRSEQKALALLKELISRFSQKGDVVVDIFAGTGSTAVACFDLREHRCFVGCEKDKLCFKHAKNHIVRRFAAAIAQEKTNIYLGSAEEEAAKHIYKRFNAPRIQDAKWTPPGGLPPYQALPKWIQIYLGSSFSCPSLPMECGTKGVHQWSPQNQALLQQANMHEARVADATGNCLIVAKSRIKHAAAGLGVFATTSICPGEDVCYYYGTLVYHNLAQRPVSKKTYGEGIMGTTIDRFKSYALKLDTSGGAFHDVRELLDGQKAVCIVPAPFCVAGYINDPRYEPDDEEYEAAMAGKLTEKRVGNAVFVQKSTTFRSSGQLVPYDAMTVKATAHISPGEEILVDYGASYAIPKQTFVQDSD